MFSSDLKIVKYRKANQIQKGEPDIYLPNVTNTQVVSIDCRRFIAGL